MSKTMVDCAVDQYELSPVAPIFVSSKVLDLNLLPDWREILTQLPVGVGVKGGIARKILKVISGLNHSHPDFAAEMNGDGDIDILVVANDLVPEKRLALRQLFCDQKFGGMKVEAKDIEISDDFVDYFRVRDVTMNEVLAFRASEGAVILYYTQEATRDIESGTIRPSIHCLANKFGQFWQYDESGRSVVCTKNFYRCIIRWLKGHGICYGINQATWDFHRRSGLNHSGLFKIMKGFVGDDEKFLLCHRHLVELGLVNRDSDSNQLWGEAVFAVNTSLARHGKRLTFTEPDAERIEQWICQKEKEFRLWEFDRRSRISLGLTVEPDIKAPVYLPDGLTNFPAYFS